MTISMYIYTIIVFTRQIGGQEEGNMSSKILLYLAIIAVTDTAKEWLWRPWDYLVCAAREMFRCGRERRSEGK